MNDVTTIVVTMSVLGALLMVVWIWTKRQRPRLAYSQFKGWARVSLLGRVEYVGAVHEVTHNGQTWIHVLTVDGSAIETQPGVVYTIQRLSFSTLTDEAMRVMDRRTYEEKSLRDQRDHARDEVDARDARIENLRKALARAHAGLVERGAGSEQPADAIVQQIEEALDADAADECPF